MTEAITGVDLVEWQLRVASGEPLPAQQDDITINGHAFEARLYAEDASKGFLPATGRLSALSFPDGVRADSGVRAGDEITPFYDPMIAKLITHGPTREVALAQLRSALERTVVAGSVTNLPFLAALTRHDGFAAGQVDTGLIERDQDALTAVQTPRLRLWPRPPSLRLICWRRQRGLDLPCGLRWFTALFWMSNWCASRCWVAVISTLKWTERQSRCGV